LPLRAVRDLREIINNREDLEDFQEDTSEGSAGVYTFTVIVRGPKETAYDNMRLCVRVQLLVGNPEPAGNFPFKSPSVCFTTPVWHPNVHPTNGAVCLDVLGSHWSPVTTLHMMLTQQLTQLLAYPNPDDPLNAEAARMLTTESEAAFRAKARRVYDSGA